MKPNKPLDQNPDSFSAFRRKRWGVILALSLPFTVVTAWAVNSLSANYGYFYDTLDVGTNAASYGPTLAVGMGNYMGASSTVAIGGNLVTHTANSLVVGTFNTSLANHAVPSVEALLILANGTGLTTDPPEVKHRNVMEVYKDGTVIINKVQGDISMGSYE